jgi:hypothetical protein
MPISRSRNFCTLPVIGIGYSSMKLTHLFLRRRPSCCRDQRGINPRRSGTGPLGTDTARQYHVSSRVDGQVGEIIDADGDQVRRRFLQLSGQPLGLDRLTDVDGLAFPPDPAVLDRELPRQSNANPSWGPSTPNTSSHGITTPRGTKQREEVLESLGS